MAIEVALPGTPLSHFVTEQDGSVPPAALDCLVTVLGGLATVAAPPSSRSLAVLDESRPCWRPGARTWNDVLLRLLARRVRRFGDHLRRSVPEFDALYAGLTRRLAALPTRVLATLHGDIYPANILVAPDLRPLAVLDFGFLSAAGDPAFDVAIAASVFNMYGPSARAIEEQLDDAMIGAFGYPRERLLLYNSLSEKT